MGEEEYRGHVVAVPYPSQGHINPTLQLCKRLVSKGLKATLAITVFISKSFNPEPSGGVHFDTISDGYDDGGFAQADSIKAYLTRLEAFGSETLTNIIVKHQNSSHPVDCIIYDPFLYWALDVAKQFGLVGAAFFTQSSAVNYIYDLIHHAKLTLPIPYSPVSIPGLPLLELRDMPSFVSVPDSYPAYFEMLLHQFSNANEADFLLVNTFYKLETQETIWMCKVYPWLPVGPTIPSAYLDQGNDKEYGLTLFVSDASICTNWLSNKARGTVVYVSFGSMGTLSGEQMVELAWGLKQSDVYFLWAMRSSEKAKLPAGFMEEMGDKGFIVSWSPQLQVLSDQATGCFFTHCGWNSTLEALSLGVPIVAMPLWTDQPTNSKYVEDIWGVGMRVKVEENGIAKREDIALCIKEVMEGERAKEMKENANRWRKSAIEAVSEGGTSDTNIDAFVSKVISRKMATREAVVGSEPNA